MSILSHRDMVIWAKEMILDGIDTHIRDNKDTWEMEPDDEEEIKKQRDRVARFLGLP